MADRLTWHRLTGLFANKFGGRVGFLKKDRKELQALIGAIKEVLASPDSGPEARQLMWSARTFKEGENPVLSVAVAPIQERTEAPAPAAQTDPFAGPTSTPPPSQDVPF